MDNQNNDTQPILPRPLETIREAYHKLGRRVDVALHTQIGDHARLDEQRRAAMSLMASVEQHSAVVPPYEHRAMEEGITAMLEALDTAAMQSLDPPALDQIPVTQVVHTGRPGRPRIEIDPTFLAFALDIRGPTGVAPVAQCAPRTVRRRALEQGLVAPGNPLYIEHLDPVTGETLRTYTSSTPAVSDLTDNELDNIMHHILEVFPTFGRRMIDGYLRNAGHRVPGERIRHSYMRVHGAPPTFNNRPIQRRVYRVAGPNSLSHHDGQHGLKRWKIVKHAFVDGFSRYVTGIQVVSNNRAESVLQLFLKDVIPHHGIPSRVRGDHGTENLGVAAWMEERYGVERGSYIWGRSVHNIRIERLWCDVTRGFGLKWSNFFLELEFGCGLNPTFDAHIWLLHHLFLSDINEDAQEWANAWNTHKLRMDDERTRSPRDMFFFGMIQNGAQGLEDIMDMAGESSSESDEEDLEDIAQYGVDWEDLNNPAIVEHHNHFNGENEDRSEGQFFNFGPAELSHVEVDEPLCPFSPAQQIDALMTISYMDPPSPRVLRSRIISGAEQVLFVPRRRSSRQHSISIPTIPCPPSPKSEISDESDLTDIDDIPGLSLSVPTPEIQVETLLDIPRLIADVENGQFSSNAYSQCPVAITQEHEATGQVDPISSSVDESILSICSQAVDATDAVPRESCGDHEHLALQLAPPVNYSDANSVPSWILAMIQSLPKRSNRATLNPLSTSAHRDMGTIPPSPNPTLTLMQKNTPAPIHTPHFIQPVQDYLQTHYSAEFSQLEAVNHQAFGSAYRHYTRYIILKHVYEACGLDINKPSLSAVVQLAPTSLALRISHQDVMQWANIRVGNFLNCKRLVLQGERARRDIGGSPVNTLTASQRVLKVHLDVLSGCDVAPSHYIAVGLKNLPEALHWTLTQLDTYTKHWK